MLHKRLKYLLLFQLSLSSAATEENYKSMFEQKQTNAALIQLLPNPNEYLVCTSRKNGFLKNIVVRKFLTLLNDKIPVLSGKLYIVAATANQPDSVDIFRIPNQVLLSSRAGRLLLFNNFGYCGFGMLLVQSKINRQSLADYNRYPYLLLLGLATIPLIYYSSYIPLIFRRQRLTNNFK